MTLTAVAVAVAVLATLVLITEVMPEREVVSPAGAAAATFATRLDAAPPVHGPLSAFRNRDNALMAQPEFDAPEVAIEPDDIGDPLPAIKSQPWWYADEYGRFAKGRLLTM